MCRRGPAKTNTSLPIHDRHNFTPRSQHARRWGLVLLVCTMFYMMSFLIPCCQTLCIYNFRWLNMPSDHNIL